MANDRADAQTILRKYDGKPQELAQYLVSICLTKTNVIKELFLLLNNFSTLDVGYRFARLISYSTLQKLVSTENGKALCERLHNWLTNVRPENPANVPNIPGNAGVLRQKLKTAIDIAKPQVVSHCGVNPVTGQPGFNAVASGIRGELRPGVGGRGHFGANRTGGRTHQGADISGSVGDSVYAALEGKVSLSSGGGYGNMVMIDHGNGYQTRYAHLTSFSVRSNQIVEGGTIIGILGQTGNANGQPASEAHVHFEIRKNGTTMNPADFLNSVCPVEFDQ